MPCVETKFCISLSDKKTGEDETTKVTVAEIYSNKLICFVNRWMDGWLCAGAVCVCGMWYAAGWFFFRRSVGLVFSLDV